MNRNMKGEPFHVPTQRSLVQVLALHHAVGLLSLLSFKPPKVSGVEESLEMPREQHIFNYNIL